MLLPCILGILWLKMGKNVSSKQASNCHCSSSSQTRGGAPPASLPQVEVHHGNGEMAAKLQEVDLLAKIVARNNNIAAADLAAPGRGRETWTENNVQTV
ncbi:hypothetical protein LR48_Vigan09g080900 [Vigna angularis]|uniref:Uncharacterized protein n=1 Tax=Phaseolus angularis TaxID=3914 RepID=A0A0L9VAQ1_PHAAN|nr:hypothetical protein LR48_Vigan09g080900 [Vigna angularis]